MRTWLAVIVGLSFAACYEQGFQTSLLHEEASIAPYVEDCQTLLSPSGAPENNLYPAAVFSQRACRGKGKAVTKMVRKPEVVLVTSAGAELLSPLYADGMQVQVMTESGLLTIGQLEDTNEGLELVLEDAIRVELRVGNSEDEMVTWESGNLAPYKLQSIYVFI